MIAAGRIRSALAGVGWFPALLAAAMVCVGLAGCATRSQLPPESFLLVHSLSARLALAKELAYAKWSAGLPVRDRNADDLLVVKACQQAFDAGLFPEMAQKLVRSQIEASYLEQEHWIKLWNGGASRPQGPVPDLAALGIQNDRLTTRVIAEWAAVEGSAIPYLALKQRLVEDGFCEPAAVAAAAFAR